MENNLRKEIERFLKSFFISSSFSFLSNLFEVQVNQAFAQNELLMTQELCFMQARHGIANSEPVRRNILHLKNCKKIDFESQATLQVLGLSSIW